MPKPRPLFRRRKTLAEKFWELTLNLCALLTAQIEDAKFKKLSPYYTLVHSKECFRENLTLKDERRDPQLLKRISSAYNTSVSEWKNIAGQSYQISDQWQEILDEFYQPLVTALQRQDEEALSILFGNFCRSGITAGLESGVDFQEFSKKGFDKVYANSYLRRINLWRAFFSEGNSISSLAFPLIGNPYGIIVDGSVIPFCSIRHNYYASRLISLIGDIQRPVVCEIGGGFGGMAYYLIKGLGRECTYINFDLPEVLSVSSYFLPMAFPEKKVLLYGEDKLTNEVADKYDIILMPHFELPRMMDASVDITFNSTSMVEMNKPTVAEYLKQIHRFTRRFFFHINYLHGAFDNFLPYSGKVSELFSLLTAQAFSEAPFKRRYILESLFDRGSFECLYERDKAVS